MVSLQTRVVCDLEARAFIDNPEQEDLHRLTAEMPNANADRHGNLDVFTRVDARSTASTYIVTDDPDAFAGKQAMSRAEYDVDRRAPGRLRPRAGDDRHRRLHLERTRGARPARASSSSARNANVAGMQKYLYFERASGGEPAVHRHLHAEPHRRRATRTTAASPSTSSTASRASSTPTTSASRRRAACACGTRSSTTRAASRMHAGCKVMPTADGDEDDRDHRAVGHRQDDDDVQSTGGAKPVQDDFIAWMPDGRIHGSENGCFAKTFELSERTEPEIYHATVDQRAYLENVYLREDGTLDFFNESFTQNGRAVFPLASLGRYEDARNIAAVSAVVILNRARGVVPAIAKLTPQQAPAYFMLGETQGTSAGGASEAGKALRVPGTNPFFPYPDAMQGNRFLELLESRPVDVYLMNTGWIVDDTGPGSKKVEVRHSSACVAAVAEGGVDVVTGRRLRLHARRSHPGHRSRRRRPAPSAAALRGARPHERLRGVGDEAEGGAHRLPPRLPRPRPAHRPRPRLARPGRERPQPLDGLARPLLRIGGSG